MATASDAPQNGSGGGPELDSVIHEITRVIEAGERIDTQSYLERYPALAPELKQFFATRAADAGDRDTGLSPGSVIDDYRIVRMIGRGGMGVVYEAEQLSLGRRVALKVLPPGVMRSSKGMADRFKREAAAVARLSHPRIVAVHGFNLSGGCAYLAMELVNGIDLAEIIDRLRTARTHGRRFVRISGPDLDQDIATWARGRRLIGTMPGDPRIAEGVVIDLRNYAHMAAAFALDAADALRHAHSHGVIHRDIKPHNLLLADNGRIKLSDFGLAKGVADGSLTKTGDFVGSPMYVSPEQAMSRRVKVDERSDIYSLGVTLYELLTLHQPFAGKDVNQILRMIITKDPPPITQLNPRLPRDIETIVMKAIEKDPDKRYQTAESLANDLRRFLNFEQIEARPLGRVTRVLRIARRNRMRLLVYGMGAVIVGLAVALWGGRLGMRQHGATVVRNITDDLARNRSRNDPVAQGALELVQELSENRPEGERRADIKRLTEEAHRLLDAGDFQKVDHALALLDTKALLGQWGTLERQLMQASLRGVKLDFVRKLQAALAASPGPQLPVRQAWLGYIARLLLDDDLQVAKNVAVALGQVRGPLAPLALSALADGLLRRSEPFAKRAIIEAMRSLGAPGALPYLLQETRAEDPWVRLAALDAMDTLDTRGVFDADAARALDEQLDHLAHDSQPWIVDRLAEVRARRAALPLPSGSSR